MKSAKMTATSLTVVLLVLGHATAQSSFKKNLATPKPAKPAQCCDEVRSLKVQVASLTSILEEMSRKQESDLMKVVRQMMELEKLNQQHEARVTEAESKYSEIYNQIEIMQLQAAQSAPQQSTSDAIYDCASLYHKNYKISGEYKLPKDDFLGTPELNVFCDMENNGGGWTVIQRRKDWEGETRYAEYGFFTVMNEMNSYKLLLANYSGNAGDSLRYHNNTNFSTKNKDNDKCVDNCAELRHGGYWYNCCTDSNLNGVFYRHGLHTKNTDGISWYGWHGPNYSLKRVEMKIRPQTFVP
ncbi:angiopoietin-related 7-like protein [Labeo rohita]|uniref:Angiopoietin-related 7-like protein n=1 Tax=Labeo rohita TaxID=84645 RepID=A0A498LVX8_LABRO|nr:angiopoietin-related 7-like protein [Labeo rohita]